MEAIKNTINNLMQEWGSRKKKTHLHDDPAIWLRQVLTKREQAHVQYNYFKKGILSIKVDSSTWLYYLSVKKDNLLTSIRKKSDAVKDIHFCIGEM